MELEAKKWPFIAFYHYKVMRIPLDKCSRFKKSVAFFSCQSHYICTLKNTEYQQSTPCSHGNRHTCMYYKHDEIIKESQNKKHLQYNHLEKP